MKDLFSAGTETSSTTLLWAILYMCKFPDVQKKLQEEVDRVIGNKRLPSRADKQNMPYVEAFTNETHRKASLLPMSVYHATAKDTGSDDNNAYVIGCCLHVLIYLLL